MFGVNVYLVVIAAPDDPALLLMTAAYPVLKEFVHDSDLLTVRPPLRFKAATAVLL